MPKAGCFVEALCILQVEGHSSLLITDHLCPGCAGGRGGGRGRGGRGGGNGGAGGIEAFVNPSMLENPWEALERRLLGGAGSRGQPQQWQQEPQRPRGASPQEGEGRAAAEGALDRPWH